MKVLGQVYDNSPIFFQNIMASVAGYKKNKNRYGNVYHKYSEYFEYFDKLSLEEKLEYQRTELIKFIQYANKHSKFYRELYKDIDLDSIQSVEDLKKLPITDKEIIRENMQDVNTVLKEDAIEIFTGGTTGKSLVVLMTPEDMMQRAAMLDNYKARVGFKSLEMRRASFTGNHIVPINQKKNIYWRYNKASKQMFFSSFHMKEENMKYYVESLNEFKPESMDGFFSYMYDIAKYIEKNNIKLEFAPIGIFPTSETLTKSGREVLERVFNCKVYDQYASSEGAPFVTECEEQVLHIELASGVFEPYGEDSNEILVTSFTTHGTPLIRYRIGDAMVFDNKHKCKCGMESPIVKEIQGRDLDYLVTAEGVRVNAANVSDLFIDMPNAVIRAQTIQDKMDEVKILLEVDKKLYQKKYDEQLKNEFIRKFGNNTRVIIEHVDEIPKEKSGKFRFIKNSINLV